jgi:hypothetical protein
MLPPPEIAREIAAQLQARYGELGYAPDTYLFRVTVDDVITVLAQRLTKSGSSPEQLSQKELDHLLDQASEYLNGEGMPWHEIVSLGLEDAWPERMKEQKEIP